MTTSNTANIISYENGSEIIQNYLDKMNKRLEQREYTKEFAQQDLAELRKVATIFEGLMKQLPEDHENLVIIAEEMEESFGEVSANYFEINEISLDGSNIDEYTDPQDVQLEHIEYSEDADEAVTRIVELASMFSKQKSPFSFKLIVDQQKASIEMKVKIVEYQIMSS